MSEPGRGLEYVKALPPDEDGRACFEALCDCGTLVVLHIEIEAAGPDSGRLGWSEAAFTCDGCQTSHWFTITAKHAPKETP